jgi:hypothetical protein
MKSGNVGGKLCRSLTKQHDHYMTASSVTYRISRSFNLGARIVRDLPV